MLEKLIGYQILEINTSEIILKKGESIITVNIEDEGGDCCGYNNISTELLYAPNSKNNPVITSIQVNENESSSDGEGVTITFFGEYAPIAKLDSYSSSGSGWGYGATVSLVCKTLGINEVVTSW